jgi:ribosome-binding factor A
MAQDQSRPPSQRQLRVGETLRHALAEIFERESFQDPALSEVTLTVTEVDASPDLRHAKVYVTRLGGGDIAAILDGLGRVKSFLRREVSRRIRLKFVPDLHFAADTTFDQADHIDALLHRPDVARDLDRGGAINDDRPADRREDSGSES